MLKFIVFWVALRLTIIPCNTNDTYNPYSVGLPNSLHNACTNIVRDSFILQFEDRVKMDSFLKEGLLRRDVDTIYAQIDTSTQSKIQTGKIYRINKN